MLWSGRYGAIRPCFKETRRGKVTNFDYCIHQKSPVRLLALAVPDPVKMEIKIAYPERDIMECTLVVIVFSVNARKIINTQREVVEAVSLMLFKSLILCVHLEDSWN